MEIFCCGHAIFVGKWTFRAIFHILTGSTLTLLMLIFTFSCICLPLVGKLLRWSVWTKSSWICSIKENRGNWLPLLHFLGVIRWVDVVLLTPTVTNICSKANSALNEVRFRRTDFGFSAQGLNLLLVMKRTQPRAFLPSKSSLFWWIFLLIEKNFDYQETLRSPPKIKGN